jgi:hypothetical protein
VDAGLGMPMPALVFLISMPSYGCFQQKTEAQLFFPNPFTVCSSSNREFVVCPFVYEETNESYPFSPFSFNVMSLSILE